MKIRELVVADLPWVESLVAERFGSPRVASRERLHEVRELPGLVAATDAKPLGVLQYQRSGNDIEIVILISTVRRQGIGRALVEAAQAMGREAGCHRLWLITTNDNRAAQAFCEAMGWSLVTARWGAVREARKPKPEIPEFGEAGTAIEDEVEFEWRCS